jgi:hypothetical protein
MTIWLILATIVAVTVTGGLAWFWLTDKPAGSKTPHTGQVAAEKITHVVNESVNNIFDNEFREELKNKGRLHFEKIIGESAMFLQQDLRLTTSQLNDYMKDEVRTVLQQEFAKYEESITSAKELALESIEKTKVAIDQQRLVLETQMNEQVQAEKNRIVEHFESNMASIINHYVLEAIGSEIDLTSQLDYIFQNLEENKQAIIQDVRSGA